MNYIKMMNEINSLCDKYKSLSVGFIGESILGKSIPLITLGEGEKQILYIGTQSGTDFGTCSVLLRFIKDYCAALEGNANIYGTPVEYINKKTTLFVLPMLNPDGVEYCIEGIGADNPIRDRVLVMNGGSEDFSGWRANARGVELGRNYDYMFSQYKSITEGCGAPEGYCGENSESEPESGALCNLLRYSKDLKGVIELFEGEEKIKYSGTDRINIARRLSDMAGYKAIEESTEACTLLPWCASELKIPAFAVGCQKTENAKNEFLAYSKIRKMLFCAPTAI